jgi:hypothetical protein
LINAGESIMREQLFCGFSIAEISIFTAEAAMPGKGCSMVVRLIRGRAQ